ncbi:MULTISPECIES: response regulator [Clostridium]|jgi:two-component system chemotaxis response regulator CheY|uniref:Stage 0 sporulation protein A homolog n=1 Tax=Clostridium saccharoperbutylacetonicum N1-4(HMT) TaxID=931276 RepID=M1MRJ7_9CLOT|nr:MULTISPECIES: response regulator [Clostridium]AGF57376.1 chemotaxis protein CheY [Clostridium saccharoperbutylacetonicum N1-4(HMT)]AQR96075.1 chemotaxis protein CheY [Clostridium saccharoperbutylacetonicum]NRT61860.1 two-component system chemotaxis response regulator CheY [Clostridium saccharoperbutylacetonicum]NSB25186.1 two-component system chemotaxis response regulator CheY [Clostridium saccharoperbutylacetonicum]NSB31944.1 two-component system chemotaxis response regulator CheY [Clostri
MKKVLVVDDAAFMRLSLKTSLEKNGYEVVGEADNGLKAVEMYKMLKPEIVTMDITMPEMDGIEALGEIMKYDPKAQVIMLSAMGQEVKIKEAVLLGAKGFVVKPFKEDYLIKALSKF